MTSCGKVEDNNPCVSGRQRRVIVDRWDKEQFLFCGKMKYFFPHVVIEKQDEQK